MSIVFVVTKGEYSSKSIVGVFSDKAVADRLDDLYGGNGLEEYDVDALSHTVNSFPKGKQIFSVDVYEEAAIIFNDSFAKLEPNTWSLENFVSKLLELKVSEIDTPKGIRNDTNEKFEIGPIPYTGILYKNNIISSKVNNLYIYKPFYHIRLIMWAKDEKHAIKIASEFRAQWWAGSLPIRKLEDN